MDLDLYQTDGIVKLLLLLSELRENVDGLYILIVYYATSR
jgi:hypothetical protein